MPTISADHPVALRDAPLQIRVTGCRPNRKIKISAEMTDGLNRRLRSWTVFDSDRNGSVDLTTQSPTSGTYDCVSPMGLFWSMAELPDQEPKEPWRSVMDGVPIHIEARAVNGSERAEIELARNFAASGVTLENVRGTSHRSGWPRGRAEIRWPRSPGRAKACPRGDLLSRPSLLRRRLGVTARLVFGGRQVEAGIGIEEAVRHQLEAAGDAQRDNLHGEKVGACENLQVRANEVFPGCCVPAPRGRRDAVAVEDIADRLIRHGGAQIRQRSDDAIVAPAGILPGQAHHQAFDVMIDSGSTGQASPL